MTVDVLNQWEVVNNYWNSGQDIEGKMGVRTVLQITVVERPQNQGDVRVQVFNKEGKVKLEDKEQQ